MPFTLDMKTKGGGLQQDFIARSNLGLQRAGFNFKVGLSRSRYPAPPPHSRYNRTYATADKAGFHIDVPGLQMSFGSTWYLPILLFPGQSGRRSGKPPLWPQKLNELKRLMIAGYKSGVQEYKSE